MELYIGLFILLIYLLSVITLDGKIPPSISDTFYTSGKWVFTIVMMIEAVLMSIALISVTPPSYQWIAFFASAALGFVGAAPHCKDIYEKKIHFAGAYTFAICSQIWVALTEWNVLFALIPIVVLCLIFRNKWTFIAEIGCILTIAITYTLNFE